MVYDFNVEINSNDEINTFLDKLNEDFDLSKQFSEFLFLHLMPIVRMKLLKN